MDEYSFLFRPVLLFTPLHCSVDDCWWHFLYQFLLLSLPCVYQMT